MVVLTDEDEDFWWAIDELSEDKKNLLWAIDELSEFKKNLVIGYILSVARVAYEKGKNHGDAMAMLLRILRR